MLRVIHIASMAPPLELCPGRMVGEDQPVFIIAEIGQNHQGDRNIAKQMIAAAKQAGVDCVKLQKSSLKDKFNKKALARPYNSENSWGETYGEHKEFLEFSQEDYLELQQYAKDQGVFFTASAMDPVSAVLLDRMDVPFIKLGSGDVNNLPMQIDVAKRGKPMVISTGMSSMSWVRTIYNNIRKYSDKFVLMQCTSSYPTQPEDVNLRVIETFREEFTDINIGYSGHEEGIAITVAAAALGATVVERHFTLDKNLKGSDHKCSLEPKELELLVHHIRNRTELVLLKDVFENQEIKKIQEAMGSNNKEVQKSEENCIRKLGKTIVAKGDIPKQTVISADMVDIKVAEPPGLDPRKVDLYIGKVTKYDIEKDESIISQMLTTVGIQIIQYVD